MLNFIIPFRIYMRIKLVDEAPFGAIFTCRRFLWIGLDISDYIEEPLHYNHPSTNLAQPKPVAWVLWGVGNVFMAHIRTYHPHTTIPE